MAKININWRNFISGESSENWTADKGFSPESFGLNLTKERGVLHFAEDATDRSTNLVDTIVATTTDPILSGNDLYLVGDEGHFYHLDGTTLTDVIDGANTYQLGTSDMTSFEGKFYATSKQSVAEFNNDVGTLTENWWSGLDTNVRHPLEVVESELFIGNDNLVLFYDGSASGTAFTLPTDQNVTSLRRHPDGKTLLAFTGDTANFSHNRSGGGKVYYCDPVLRDWTREVVLGTQVEGTQTVGGIIFATWGNNLGFFDGDGLSFLKKLVSPTTYSQSMGSFEDIFIVRDTTFVKAFGNLGAGKVWWTMYKNQTNGFSLSIVAYKGDNKLIVGFDDGAGAGVLEEVDYDNSGSAGRFITNRIFFPEEVEIDKLEFLHDTTATKTEFDVAEVTVGDALNTIVAVRHANQSTNKTETNTNI